jgi:hypothetical protein
VEQPAPRPEPRPAPAPKPFVYQARPESEDEKPMNLDEAKEISRLMVLKKAGRELVIEKTQRDPFDIHLLCKDAKAIIAFLNTLEGE